MKRIITCILLIAMLLGCLCACNLTNPVPAASTEPTTESNTPITYQILYAKVNVAAGIQMTAENIDQYFEARSTTDVNIANQGIPYTDRYSILEGVYTQREIYQGAIVTVNDFSKVNKVSGDIIQDGHVLTAIDVLTEDDIRPGDLVYVPDSSLLYDIKVVDVTEKTNQKLGVVLDVLDGEQSRELIEASYRGDVTIRLMDSFDKQYMPYRVKTNDLSCTAVILHFLDDDKVHRVDEWNHWSACDTIRFTFNCTYLDLLLQDGEFVASVNSILRTCQKAGIPFKLEDYVSVSHTTIKEERPEPYSRLYDDNRPLPLLEDQVVFDISVNGDNSFYVIEYNKTWTPQECINNVKYNLVGGKTLALQYCICTPDGGGRNGYVKINVTLDMVTQLTEDMNIRYGDLAMG